MIHQGFCAWYDLFSNDVEKSISFYSQLFGWEIEEWKIEGAPSYKMFKVADKVMGGFTSPPVPELANSWLAYVTVANLQDAVQKIQVYGGDILFEKSVPQVGSWVIAKDSEGSVFAPFQPETPESQILPNASSGFFCWHELLCKKQDSCFQFYSSLFSWKKGVLIAQDKHQGGYQIYHQEHEDQKGMGGIMQICEEMPPNTPSQWVEYILVENIETLISKAISLGASPTFPVTEIVNGGKIAGLLDPHKASFAVIEAGKMK